jgi:SulP family sulfate permease
VVSLMTATSIGDLAAIGSAAYWSAATTLALLSGLVLLLMGVLRLGFLANFLSHPVISGFISASALLIAAGQLKTILGIDGSAHSFFGTVLLLLTHLPQIQLLSAAVGLGTAGFLWWGRKALKPLLVRHGASARAADVMVKATPVLAIVATTLATWHFGWHEKGLKIVGDVPQGLPPFTLPSLDPALLQALLVPAMLISVVGFVESVSVGQTLAARRRERIEPDQELIALGASNLSAAFTAGLPVTGGFARSVVNFDAGAQTPAAGMFTAAGIALASLLLTPALHFLPQVTLAAAIIVAVLSLVDTGLLGRTWAYSRTDFAAMVSTVFATLSLGVEAGLITGVGVSLALFLYRSSQPHIAEVGLVAGTEHFRNVLRHPVLTSPRLLGLRVDESLYFANARSLEDFINAAVSGHPQLEHLVLMCSAVNSIDASALESLEAIEHRLREAGIRLHLSEVKGPVMDRLKNTDFIRQLSGQVFLSHYQAVHTLAPELTQDGPQG